jgi:hypothetical protein
MDRSSFDVEGEKGDLVCVEEEASGEWKEERGEGMSWRRGGAPASHAAGANVCHDDGRASSDSRQVEENDDDEEVHAGGRLGEDEGDTRGGS